MKKINERIRKLEQQIVKEPYIIDDVIMLEDGRFMCTPRPFVFCEGETFELPMIAAPGSSLEKYCQEMYHRETPLYAECQGISEDRA